MAILTQPVISTSFGIVANNILIPNISSAPNNIKIVNQIPYEYNTTLKWMYSVTDAATANIASGEISAIVKSNTVIYTIFGVTGDRLQYSIEPIIIDVTVALQFTNLSENLQTLNLRRLQL
jgi:hypothetical protein